MASVTLLVPVSPAGAQERSPQHQLWENNRGTKDQAPEGRKRCAWKDSVAPPGLNNALALVPPTAYAAGYLLTPLRGLM
jgi:hypothetical protein